MCNSVRLNTGLLIGDLYPIRINCNVGCNEVSDYQDELQKLRILKEKDIVPDMMMDLSLVELENPLYLTIKFAAKKASATVAMCSASVHIIAILSL